MTKEIQLANNKGTALVDDEDFELVNKYKWCSSHGYARAVVNGKKIHMHRLILGFQKNSEQEIDHINGDELDNRRFNLRLCTHRQNSANRRKGCGTSSGYKGVTWDKATWKWMAQIMVNYRNIHLGRFIDEIAAARAYDVAARKHFGKFARTNFPLEAQDSSSNDPQKPHDYTQAQLGEANHIVLSQV